MGSESGHTSGFWFVSPALISITKCRALYPRASGPRRSGQRRLLRSGITTANIRDGSGTVLAASAGTVPHWFEENVCLNSAKRYLRGSYTPPGSRPTSLIDSTRAFFSRSRPQYQSYADTQFVSHGSRTRCARGRS
ncbi:hypothetical protein B0H14DRAFT_2765954, partial [Mycena olivaceomarginata]